MCWSVETQRVAPQGKIIKMNYSIETENLSLWYGDFRALIDVNMRIRDGQITSLIGPSGCGKSTLLRCFNRVNERYGNVTTKGKIEVLGKNIYDADVSLPELRKAVGMVFQRPNPLPISVYENICSVCAFTRQCGV